ncbi:hypothetical protein EWP86_09760 [Campylobacter jejuni]|nr:hypothetical protein [Campylobacter jejuni]
MKKRLAIQLYGHVRTFEYTSKNFFKNIVNPNLKDGYKVDIFFIHGMNLIEKPNHGMIMIFLFQL